MSMKLLVGGDSFAQSPIFVQTPIPHTTEPNIHWCELLAASESMQVDFTGLGGGDISTCTLRTVQSLLNGDYSHCIFFVTDWYRDVVHSKPADPRKKFVYGSPMQFYSDTDLPDYYFNRTVFTDKARYRLTGIFSLTEEAEHQTQLMHYLQLKADYTYTHDRLSNLSLLAHIAQQKNVKLMFVEIFTTNMIDNLADFGQFIPTLQSDTVFNYFSLMETSHGDFYAQEENSYWRGVPSHHSPSQHRDILEIFLSKYPSWLT